jgi:hypothetical protein
MPLPTPKLPFIRRILWYFAFSVVSRSRLSATLLLLSASSSATSLLLLLLCKVACALCCTHTFQSHVVLFLSLVSVFLLRQWFRIPSRQQAAGSRQQAAGSSQQAVVSSQYVH